MKRLLEITSRRYDVRLLRESDLNMRMIALTADLPPEDTFKLYGDSAHAVMQSVMPSVTLRPA
jgi:hypothetical protein